METDELVNKILEIVNTMSQTNLDTLSGDTLSRLAVRLASYKASLGVKVANARQAAWDAEATYYNERAQIYKDMRDDGTGVTDSEELKRAKSYSWLKEWNEAKYQYERLNKLHIDCHDLIDALRSRLIHLQSERKEAEIE